MKEIRFQPKSFVSANLKRKTSDAQNHAQEWRKI